MSVVFVKTLSNVAVAAVSGETVNAAVPLQMVLSMEDVIFWRRSISQFAQDY
ncbi:MAG TPA: hypothetical protein VE396_17775 [Xanthobacteraceae bacterium]|nr:hypothetical protein [Xanthobacteraceae bacterium]